MFGCGVICIRGGLVGGFVHCGGEGIEQEVPYYIPFGPHDSSLP